MFAGSFDPFTNGHLDLVERAAVLFDEVLVAVGDNPAKRTLFTTAERVAMVTEVVGGDRIRSVSFSGLLVDAASAHGAGVLIRGLRGAADMDLEGRNGLANRDLSGVETLFLLSAPQWSFVSSSLVKEIAAHGGDVSGYVPPAVLAALARALH